MHHKPGGYNKGCRCEACREKHRVRMARYQNNRRTRDPGYYLSRKASSMVERSCRACNQPLLKGGARSPGVTMHKACRLRIARKARYHRAVQARINRIALGTVSPYLWTQGECFRCGTSFCVRATGPAKYCTDACANRTKQSRRRAVICLAFVADVSPTKVFEADGYRCHLCRRLTLRNTVVPHPRAPTVDHVIPLARGGTHEPSNCRTACFLCNSTKRDSWMGEQLALAL
jgi:5-methylcytosine-specific restriction endonuclease McrA